MPVDGFKAHVPLKVRAGGPEEVQGWTFHTKQ